MKTARFEIGKVYSTIALYGGFYFIKVIDRTEEEISFIYMDDADEEINVKEISHTTMTVFGKELEELGEIDTERIEAWTYHSPYARDENDVDRGYFSAFNCDNLYTKEEYDAM